MLRTKLVCIIKKKESHIRFAFMLTPSVCFESSVTPNVITLSMEISPYSKLPTFLPLFNYDTSKTQG